VAQKSTSTGTSFDASMTSWMKFAVSESLITSAEAGGVAPSPFASGAPPPVPAEKLVPMENVLSVMIDVS